MEILKFIAIYLFPPFYQIRKVLHYDNPVSSKVGLQGDHVILIIDQG